MNMTKLKTTLLNIKSNDYKLRLINSSSCLYMDDITIERRIEKLKFENLSNLKETINNESASQVDISLSKEQIEKLRSGLSEILNNSDIETSGEYMERTMSTFKESFPNYKNESELFDLVNNLSKTKDGEINKILEESGLIEGLKLLINKPNLLEDLTEEQFKKVENKLDQYINMISPKPNTITELLKKDNNVTIIHQFDINNLRNQLNLSDQTIERLRSQADKLDLIISAGAIITPVLAVRALIKTYSSAAFPREGYKNLSPEQMLKMNRIRIREIRIISLVLAPMVIGSYLWIGRGTTLFSVHVGDTGSSATTTSSLILFKNNSKIPKWLQNIVAYLLLIIIFEVVRASIKYFNPTLYETIINLESYWITYPILVWLIGWILFFILKLYLLLTFSLSKFEISKPKYLPFFILKWLNELEELSKLDINTWYIRVTLRTIFFLSLFTSIFTYFFIL